MIAPTRGGGTMTNGAWHIETRRRLLAPIQSVVAPQKLTTHCQHRARAGGCGRALDAQTAELHVESCKKGGGVATTHNSIHDILWKFIKDNIDPHALREQRLESLKLGRLQGMLPGDGEADVLDVV